MRSWYTQAGAGTVARRRMEHILAAIRSLPDHPERHPANRYGRREFSVEGYRVHYRIRPNDVLVLRVFGPGQARQM